MNTRMNRSVYVAFRSLVLQGLTVTGIREELHREHGADLLEEYPDDFLVRLMLKILRS